MNERSNMQLAQFNPLVPQTIDEAIAFASHLAKSELVPKDFRGKPENVLVAIQWGFELGIQPMQAIQNIAVINGRPSIWGDLGLALVWASGLCEYFEEDPSVNGCTCRTRRKGASNEEVRTFTMEDARRAKLAEKDNYKQYPARMLQMRARWWLMRDVYPDVLKGVPSAEENQDAPPEVEVNAAPVKKPRAKAAPAAVDATPTEDGGEGKGAGAAALPGPSTQAAEATKRPGDDAPAAAHMVELVKKKLAQKALTEPECFKRFGMEGWDKVTVGRINEILEWMLDPAS